MKVAAYQAPLSATDSSEAVGFIRQQVERCEQKGVTLLCCPEALLGGLADYSDNPAALAVDTAQLNAVLAPLASETVTTLVGFTERGDDGRLYNSAAVMQRGSMVGLYRKQHPAINRSVYAAGRDTPVFRIQGLTFGIVICNDSNFPELVRAMSAQGATALFVPTNNGLPSGRADGPLVARTRAVDIALATENQLWVIRADVAGRKDQLVSHGSSGIVRPDGKVMQSGRTFSEDLLVVEMTTPPWR